MLYIEHEYHLGSFLRDRRTKLGLRTRELCRVKSFSQKYPAKIKKGERATLPYPLLPTITLPWPA